LGIADRVADEGKMGSINESHAIEEEKPGHAKRRPEWLGGRRA
jgi:hypothetical protein